MVEYRRKCRFRIVTCVVKASTTVDESIPVVWAVKITRKNGQELARETCEKHGDTGSLENCSLELLSERSQVWKRD